MTDILTIDQLVIGYDRPLSTPLTLTIPSGVGVGIIGANGSGKSTLARTVAGLVPPLQGDYAWKEKTRFGYVPQEEQVSLLIPMTVADLLKMGNRPSLPRFRHSTAEFESQADHALGEMEISRFKTRLFSELSRGQRQRALIARALIGNPDVLLLDEPYNALDDLFRKKLHHLLEERRQKSPFSFFIIEHDLNRVINQVDWVIILAPHQAIFGKKTEVLTREALSHAYGTQVHLHKENGEIQVHFL